MKTVQTLVMTAVLVLSNVSLASSMIDQCSNSEGTIRITEGFQGSKVVMTEVHYSSQGVTSNEITFNRHDLVIEDLKSTKLHEENRRNCDGDLAWYLLQTITYKQAQFRKKDGTAFSTAIPGASLSEDRKVLKTHLICEREITGMAPCQ